MEEKVRGLAKERLEYGKILKAALVLEAGGAGRRGWEWHQVGGHPGMLTKLVGEGVIRVVSKGRRTRYRLVDREATKRGLEGEA
jgi:hypothetical protein